MTSVATALTWANVADVFAAASAVMGLLTVPYSLWALFSNEGHPAIRHTRKDSGAHFHPSLFSLSWITRLHTSATVFLLFNYVVRVLYNLDPGTPVGQPAWSYPLSMISTTILLACFVTPAVFLSWVKHRIVEEDDKKKGG